MAKKSEVSGPAYKPNNKSETGNSGGKAYTNPVNIMGPTQAPEGAGDDGMDDFGGVSHDLSAGAALQTPVGTPKDVSVKGGIWDGAAVDDPVATDYGRTVAGRTGKPTELNQKGAGVEPGGLAEADAALAEIGPKVTKGSEISSLLNGKYDRGEKIDLPSEGNLNSANQRMWNG